MIALTALFFSSLAWADDDGQLVGVQCWENGVLVGHQLPYTCPEPSGGGGGGVIMGPPVIVWVRPSAAGSQMQGLAPVNSGLVNQLSAIADTPVTFRQKAEFAMKNGNFERAKRLLEEADRRFPDDPDVREGLRKLQNLFDNGTASLTVPPPLELSQQEFLKPMPEVDLERFKDDSEVKALRDDEITSYNQLANADAAFNSMTANTKAGTATQSDVAQAQLKLNAAVEKFKNAENKLKQKIYVLDKTKKENR